MPAPLRPMCGEAERRASVAQALLLAASALLPTLAAAVSAHSNSQSRSGRCRAESCERKTMRGSGWASLLMTPRMINDAENDVSAVPEIQIALSLGQRVRPDREAGMPGHRDAVAQDGLPFVFGRRGRGPLLLAAEKARQHLPGFRQIDDDAHAVFGGLRLRNANAGKAAKFGRDLLDHQGAIRVQLGSGLHRKHLARLAGEFHRDTRQGRPVGVRGERGGCPERRQALETYLRWDVYRP